SLNAFIAGNHLSYTNLSSASDTLGITIDDQGHTGAGGPLTGHVDVPVATPLPTPDASPGNFLTSPFLAPSRTHRAIAGFSVSDPDGGNSIETATLSVQHGTLTVGTVAGGAAVAGSGSATVTLNGTVAQIDATLAAFDNLVYHSAAHFIGFDNLKVV